MSKSAANIGLISLAIAIPIFQIFWLDELIQINQFFVRDFIRAMLLQDGHLVFVGSDTPSSGYTLGPFFYFLAFPFTYLDNFAQGFVYFFFVVRTACIYYLARTLHLIHGVSLAVAFIFLQSSFSLWATFRTFNNAAVGSTLMIFCLAYIYSLYHKKDQGHWAHIALFSLFLGFCLHLHYTFLYAIVLYLYVLWHVGHSRKSILVNALLLLLPQGFFIFSMINVTYVRSLGDTSGVLFSSDWLARFSKRVLDFSLGSFYSRLRWQDIYGPFENYLLFCLVSCSLFLKYKKGKPMRAPEVFFLISALLLPASYFNIGFRVIDRYFSFTYVMGYIIGIILLHKVLKPKHLAALAVFAGITFNFLIVANGKMYEKVTLKRASEICDVLKSKGISYQDFNNNAFEYVDTKNFIKNDGTYKHNFSLIRVCMGTSSSPSQLVNTKFLLLPSKEDFSDKIEQIVRERLPRDFIDSKRVANIELLFEGTSHNLYQISLLSSPKDVELATTNLSFGYQLDPAIKYHSSKKNYWNENDSSMLRISLCPFAFYCDLYVTYNEQAQGIFVWIMGRMLKMGIPLESDGEIKNLKLHYKCEGRNEEETVAFNSQYGKAVDHDKTHLSYLTSPIGVLVKNCRKLDSLSINFDYDISWLSGSRWTKSKGLIQRQVF